MGSSFWFFFLANGVLQGTLEYEIADSKILDYFPF